MVKKNEAPIILLSLLITTGLLGLGVWWLSRQAGVSWQQLTRNGQLSGSTFADVRNVPPGVFNYGGSTTWAPIRGQIDPVIQTVFPDFKLRYTDPPAESPGSGTGIRMLLDGQLAGQKLIGNAGFVRIR